MIQMADQSTPNISNRIAEIIDKRHGLAKQIQPVYQHLSKLTQEIIDLEQHRQQLTIAIDNAEVDRRLREVNLEGIKQKIAQESKELETLVLRLSRPTLNIGVVGKMGQGKSTFLKSLSGLSNHEIPANPGGACTAVRSRICHHDGDTEATVIIHSEHSFLEEVIGEYYRDLNLGTVPINIDAFGNNPLPQSPTGATKEEMYKRLRDDYYLTFSKYRPLLKSGDPRQISIGQQDIPKYVSQQRDKDQKNLISFEHLVVRDVEIRCRFPKVEVNKLGLLDVPGLGDTRAGDEQLILKTLAQEVDVVLFFRMPEFFRYQWQDYDTNLYDLANQALDNLSNRSFMVLNHVKLGDKDNLNGCNTLKSDLGSIKVVDCKIADCANADDTNQVLDGVLQYLDRKIIEIEEQSARSCQNRLLEIFSLLNSELSKAQNALLTYGQESPYFESRFAETIKAITKGLNNLLNELWKKHQEIDADFAIVVKNALEICEKNTGIPSEEDIQDKTQSLEYKNSYRAARLIYQAELRCHLSKNFLSLDRGLEDASNKLKRQIADVLINQGGLRELANSLDAEGIEFLETIAGILHDRGHHKLELAFTTLLEFKMSYAAQILSLIREKLTQELGGVRADAQFKDISGTTNSVKTAGEIVANKIAEPVKIGVDVLTQAIHGNGNNEEIDRNAGDVREKLQQLHRKAVDECKQTLDRWLVSPNRARYYMAEEFVDRLLYEEGMSTEWRLFLNDHDIRAQVWIEFKQIEERKQVEEKWLTMVKKVRDLNQPDLLRFI
jgi:energy-coupling factor transporter ATP-binding protein EcfA2